MKTNNGIPAFDPSFGFCALHYLLAWLRHEKRLHMLMRSEGDQLELGIKRALPYFQVARGFPDISNDDGKGLKAIRRALERADACTHDPVQCVVDLSAALRKSFQKDLVSAASKLLWLRHRAPFVIYDSRAAKSLEFKRNVDGIDYPGYWEKWHLDYQERRADIKAAVTMLGELHDPLRPLVPEWDAKEVSGRWFAERVFDRYLWMCGDKKRDLKRA